ncbi:hypothetical protein C3Y08_01920 [Burkholderia gladioli]|uniref:phage tail fiber protein n=1 Tax=Burkholderia gladioli TaxID=28095 RepID=UPI000CDB1C32|nr:hypothetical protein [Burkholderia gladioli]POS10229.1 hypothetical protein C3Y08_01920 [Burkholderia gladioli]
MSGTITSANSVIMLGVSTIFPIAQQIQGYTADDIFDTDDVDMAEVVIGLDGKQSAGWVPYNVKWRISLMPNSDSILIFDAVITAERVAQEKFTWNGVATLKGISKKFTMSNGVLTRGKPIPDAKKTLQPQTYEITWESVLPSPM